MEVGQTVYVKRIGNATRNKNKDDLIFEVVVEKIGNKYFYLNGMDKCKFYIDNMHQEAYPQDYQVYLSKQDILDEWESDELEKNIREKFDYCRGSKLPLEKLRKIWQIINE